MANNAAASKQAVNTGTSVSDSVEKNKKTQYRTTFVPNKHTKQTQSNVKVVSNQSNLKTQSDNSLNNKKADTFGGFNIELFKKVGAVIEAADEDDDDNDWNDKPKPK